MVLKLLGREIEIRAPAKTKTKAPRKMALAATDGGEGWTAYLSGAGYDVSPLTALRVSAVFRCVDVVAKTMASLPLFLYHETQSGKEKAREHRLYPLLHALPNPYTTAYSFWHMYVANLMLTRGAFARIERDAGGYIAALWNIPTGAVSGVHINPATGEPYIIVSGEDGTTQTLYDGDFMYTPSFLFSSAVDPISPVTIAADVLGLTMALNGYAKSSFEAGTNPGGFIEHPGQLSDAAYARFVQSFTEKYAGIQNQHKWLFLEEGAKAQPFERDMEKTQALESRKFAVTEVCRMFGVPPHLVYDLDRATFSNIEQQSIEFVQNCISPMAVRLEQTIYKDLLNPRERRRYFAKFNVNGLMRGDMAARTAYYNSARQNGWMSGDEIRELEDMNRMPDGLGGLYLVNGTMKRLEDTHMQEAEATPAAEKIEEGEKEKA